MITEAALFISTQIAEALALPFTFLVPGDAIDAYRTAYSTWGPALSRFFVFWFNAPAVTLFIVAINVSVGLLTVSITLRIVRYVRDWL